MLRKRLREVAMERRRFGYRRLALLLAREGYRVNHKKLYRLYREEGLTVRKRRGRKRAMGQRAPMGALEQINQRWSIDFMVMRWKMDAGSAFCALSTSSRASAYRRWSTARSQERGWCASWTA